MSAIRHKTAMSLERCIQPLGLLFASWGENMSQDVLCCCFTKPSDDSLEGEFWDVPLKWEMTYVCLKWAAAPGYTNHLCDRETGLLTYAHRWKNRNCAERDMTWQPELVSHSCPILWLLQCKLCLELPAHLEHLLPAQMCWCLVQQHGSFSPVGALICILFYSVQWPVILKWFLHNLVLPWRPLYFCHTAKRRTMDWDGIMRQGLWHVAYCTLHNRHISVVLEAWPVSERQSVKYENMFSGLYNDATGFTTCPPHLVEEKSVKVELWWIP